MLYTLLQPWDSVEFEIEIDERKYIFRSAVAEIPDGDEEDIAGAEVGLNIYFPTSIYPDVEVPIGQAVIFTFFVLNGGILRFNGRIVSTDGIYLAILLDSDGDIVERREKYRFDVDIPIKVNEGQVGFIKNISLKGIQLASNVEYELDDRVNLEVDIFSNVIKLRGTVVRKEMGADGNFKYEYGVRYRNLSRDQSLLVIDFIFELQRRKLLS